jgi:hypothetical protein
LADFFNRSVPASTDFAFYGGYILAAIAGAKFFSYSEGTEMRAAVTYLIITAMLLAILADIGVLLWTRMPQP